ncbi:MAG: NYN domain-containing protein [Nitrospirae bacterium]|nr:NYN domain-containing protein [Nitrospirota bacterium]
MSHILIDGYNLIGIAHWNLEKARNVLVQKLYEYAQIKGHTLTIVFDGWKDGKLTETKTKIGKVTVIFSKLGEKADHVIRLLISAAATPWIVVSSDREIYDFAEKKDFVALTADEFEEKLHAALDASKNNEAEWTQGADEDIDAIHSRQKGNPKKLSKKEKKKIETLKKL